jgi:hypothetical protein
LSAIIAEELLEKGIVVIIAEVTIPEETKLGQKNFFKI